MQREGPDGRGPTGRGAEPRCRLAGLAFVGRVGVPDGNVVAQGEMGGLLPAVGFTFDIAVHEPKQLAVRWEAGAVLAVGADEPGRRRVESPPGVELSRAAAHGAVMPALASQGRNVDVGDSGAGRRLPVLVDPGVACRLKGEVAHRVLS